MYVRRYRPVSTLQFIMFALCCLHCKSCRRAIQKAKFYAEFRNLIWILYNKNYIKVQLICNYNWIIFPSELRAGPYWIDVNIDFKLIAALSSFSAMDKCSRYPMVLYSSCWHNSSSNSRTISSSSTSRDSYNKVNTDFDFCTAYVAAASFVFDVTICLVESISSAPL